MTHFGEHRPIGADRATIIVLLHGAPPDQVWRAAANLGAGWVVSLPDGWPWLLAELLGPIPVPS